VLREPKPHPFAATRRQQIWSVDIRYIEDHGLDTAKPVYVIALLEKYSRAILASLLSPRRDLTAYLVVLRDAVQRFGAPELLVRDSGGVFLAKQAQAIYRALGIEKRAIARGRPWQNYIEANFGTMRRMADDHFAKATTWPERHAVHARFFHDDNGQKHFAHQERPAGEQHPAHVLHWVQGAWCAPAELDRLFRVRAHRRVDGAGFVRFRNWRLYGERGLAGAEAAVWARRSPSSTRPTPSRNTPWRSSRTSGTSGRSGTPASAPPGTPRGSPSCRRWTRSRGSPRSGCRYMQRGGPGRRGWCKCRCFCRTTSAGTKPDDGSRGTSGTAAFGTTSRERCRPWEWRYRPAM